MDNFIRRSESFYMSYFTHTKNKIDGTYLSLCVYVQKVQKFRHKTSKARSFFPIDSSVAFQKKLLLKNDASFTLSYLR